MRKTKRKAGPTDQYIGAKLRSRREILGLSQESLSAKTDMTFQQLQKFESGKNRITAVKLLDFSRVLDVPITYFYDGLDQGGADFFDPLDTTEAHKLVRAWFAIKSEATRKAIMKMIKVSADGEVHAAE